MSGRLLVTGGAGFIGANFVPARIAAGDQVALDQDVGDVGDVDTLLAAPLDLVCDHPVV